MLPLIFHPPGAPGTGDLRSGCYLPSVRKCICFVATAIPHQTWKKKAASWGTMSSGKLSKTPYNSSCEEEEQKEKVMKRLSFQARKT